MKAKTIIYFLILTFLVITVNAQERGPAVVSPGSDVGIAIVGESCPTFSWTGVVWANAYRVAVFQAASAEALPYEEMEALASPVLRKEIQGRALSWTPSSEERLSNGGMYVWYVQAKDAYGKVIWSEGKVFKVEVEARLVGMEETVRESLKDHGVSDDVIDDVLRDMESGVKEVVLWGVDTAGSGTNTQDKFGIQGVEGTYNTYYGLNAGASLTALGQNNSFFGGRAGYSTISDNDNTFLGYSAGYYSTANRNTFVGSIAGYYNTTGDYNTFIGNYAGYGNTTGNSNTFMGMYAGYSNTSGQGNVFLGNQAGYHNTANYNTIVGHHAGHANTSGTGNIFLGHEAGFFNSTGYNNTFLGYRAGYYSTANYNTFVGYYAGYNNTSGLNNTFLGVASGYNNTSGSYNTLIGHYAGYNNTTAIGNTFVGYFAGRHNTGGFNTSLGYQAGASNTTGQGNTFLGYYAGYNNTTAGTNTFIGYEAGRGNTTAIGNTFMGARAGYNSTTGNYNTFIGRSAGYNNTSGQGNVFLGNQAGVNETGSNKLYIDNSDTSSPLIYGEFDNDIVAINGKLGVGTQSPGYPMHLQKTGANAAFIAERTDGAINYINATAGYGNFGTVNNYPLRMVVNAVWRMRLDSDNSLTMANGASCTVGGVWTDASSIELKENIHSLTTEEAIDALNGLNPVKYNYKADREEDCVGFIAEEVPDLVASKDRKGMSPMDVVAVLTKVVQEQQKLAEKQQKRDEEQQRTIEELREQIDELERKSK